MCTYVYTVMYIVHPYDGLINITHKVKKKHISVMPVDDQHVFISMNLKDFSFSQQNNNTFYIDFWYGGFSC